MCKGASALQVVETVLLVAVNGDSSEFVFIDVSRHAVVGKVSIGGQLEAAAADGDGMVYVNGESRNSVAAVDVVTRKLSKRIDLGDRKESNGLANDPSDGLLISVCRNGCVKFIIARDGREVATFKVSKGSDGVMYDPNRHVAFRASADEGTLSVMAVRAPTDIKPAADSCDPASSALGALDTATGKVFLPTAIPDRAATPITRGYPADPHE